MIQKRSFVLGLVVLLAACGSPTGPALESGDLLGARSSVVAPEESTEIASPQEEEATTSATTGTETEGTTESRGGGYAGSPG